MSPLGRQRRGKAAVVHRRGPAARGEQHVHRSLVPTRGCQVERRHPERPPSRRIRAVLEQRTDDVEVPAPRQGRMQGGVGFGGRRARLGAGPVLQEPRGGGTPAVEGREVQRDRKSTRLNSSHVKISYAVFCLKKKQTSHSLPTPPSTRPSSA